VERFFGALHDQDWIAAAALVDTEEIGKLRVLSLQHLVSWARAGKPTPGNSGPLDIVGFGEADTMMVFLYDTVSVPGLARPITIGQLARLPLRELMVLTLASRFRSEQSSRRVIGSVAEADSVTHVLVRQLYGSGVTDPSDPYRVDIVHLRLMDGAWRVAASTNVWSYFDLYLAAVSTRLR
jgi:hypothetical protein